MLNNICHRLPAVAGVHWPSQPQSFSARCHQSYQNCQMLQNLFSVPRFTTSTASGTAFIEVWIPRFTSLIACHFCIRACTPAIVPPVRITVKQIRKTNQYVSCSCNPTPQIAAEVALIRSGQISRQQSASIFILAEATRQMPIRPWLP